MQTFSLYILHHKVDIFRSINSFKEPDNIVMTESGEDSNLSDGLFFTLNIHKFNSIILLDGHSFATWLVYALFHYGIGTVSNLLTEMIIIQV